MTTRRAEFTAEAQARLEAIYERVRQSFPLILTTIDEAIDHLATGALTEADRQGAERAAHRLAGSAAMVGFPEATAGAQRLESAFGGSGIRPDDAAQLQTEADALRRNLCGQQQRSR